MARGRNKDLTIQPSRSLTLQRAYRDRKAKHLADLEERCRKAEAENEGLRKELADVRAQLQAASASSAASYFGHNMIQASADLMQNLVRTTGSLSRLEKQIALGTGVMHSEPPKSAFHENDRVSSTEPGTADVELAGLLSYFSSHASSGLSAAPSSASSASTSSHPMPIADPEVTSSTSQPSMDQHQDAQSWSSDPADPQCCVGLLDCRGLLEDEGLDVDALSRAHTTHAGERPMPRMSGHRSTLFG